MSTASCDGPVPAISAPTVSAAKPEPRTERSTYGQILKSTALVGGSSALNVAIGIVRTKAMAMLLGPAGFGLFGIYSSVVSLTQSIAGMGINSSGVRQIAEAAGSGNDVQIAETAAVLRRTSVFLGAMGAIVLALLSRQVSTFTFGGRSALRRHMPALDRRILQSRLRRPRSPDSGHAPHHRPRQDGGAGCTVRAADQRSHRVLLSSAGSGAIPGRRRRDDDIYVVVVQPENPSSSRLNPAISGVCNTPPNCLSSALPSCQAT